MQWTDLTVNSWFEKHLFFYQKFSLPLCKEDVKSLEKRDYPFFQPESTITPKCPSFLVQNRVLALGSALLFTHAWNGFYLPSFSWLVIKLSGSAAALGIKKQLPHEQGGTLTSHFIQFFVTRLQNKWSFCGCLFEELFIGRKRPAVWSCIQKSLIYLGKDWQGGGQA